MNVPKNFNWRNYLDLNPDLKLAGLKTQRQAEYHYFHYGRKLGYKYQKISQEDSLSDLSKSESLILMDDLNLLEGVLEEYNEVKYPFEIIFGFTNNSAEKLEKLLIYQNKHRFLHCFGFKNELVNKLDILKKLCLYEKIILYPEKEIIIKKSLATFDIDLESFESLRKVKLGILTASWKRKPLTLRYCSHWDYLIDFFSKHITITSVVVDSESTNKDVIKNSKSVYLNYANDPLSNKFNYGMNHFRNLSIDYVMVMGSDNFVDEILMFEFLKIMRNGYDLIGVLNSFIYEVKTGTLFNYLGYPKKSHRFKETIGAGRILSKKLLNALNFHPWKPGLSKGLDGSMWHKLSFLKYKEYKIDLKPINGLMLGVKTNVFITDLKKMENKVKVDKKLVLKIKSLKGICY